MTDDHLDACLGLFSDRCRREAIRQLRHETGGSSTVDDLVDRLWRSDAVPPTDEQEARDWLAVHLVHVHLPKLAAHDVVEYDPGSGHVRYRRDERIERALDALSGAAPQANP